jgi:aromatic-L-amino-acid/L-tryptophan decarboxylase
MDHDSNIEAPGEQAFHQQSGERSINPLSTTSNPPSDISPSDIPHSDIPAEEFRSYLHQVADWVADYREHIAERRISPVIEPGQIIASLPSSPPEQAEQLRVILEDLDRLIMPGMVHWGHPSFLGYFGSTTNAPGILAEMIAAALNVSAMTWRTSPAATELETLVLEWLRQMLSLPEAFKGVVYDTASVAIVHALAAAREATGLEIREKGLAGRSSIPTLRVYASDQAHSSVEKAAIMLGIGESNVVRVRSDDEYRLDVSALRAAIDDDRDAGMLPLAVVATVGTTSSTSVDPVEAIAEVCLQHHLWLHVDAAYGGAMALLPEGLRAMRGVERADSFVINPHKWLFVPLDFSALYTRHPEILRAVFSLVPEYLRGDAGHAETNYMDYGIQLGRRFRALKAWMVWRTFGREGLAARIREHIRLARLCADWIEGQDDFELLAPVTMAVVCFRARPPELAQEDENSSSILDQFNRELVEAVNATGKAYLTHTRLHQRLSMRLAVGNILTTDRHLEQTWQLILNETERLRARMKSEG